MATNNAKKSWSRGRAFGGIVFTVLIICSILTLAALSAGCRGSGFIREAAYTPGIYEGTGRGFRGPIYVRVQVSAAGIEDITITGHEEGIFPGVSAMEELLESVLESGSTDLDAVSGATFSSRGFLDAIEEALGKAAASANKD